MAIPVVFKRFDRSFFKTRGDGAMVPIVGSELAFYAQGATLAESVFLATGATTTTPRQIYHPGAFAVPNPTSAPYAAWVYSEDGAHKYEVELWLAANGLATFKNLGAGYTFPIGARFLNVTAPILIYQNPQAAIQPPDPVIVQTDTDGRAACYVSAYRYDFVVPYDGGAKVQVFIDAEGSFVMR